MRLSEGDDERDEITEELNTVAAERDALAAQLAALEQQRDDIAAVSDWFALFPT